MNRPKSMDPRMRSMSTGMTKANSIATAPRRGKPPRGLDLLVARMGRLLAHLSGITVTSHLRATRETMERDRDDDDAQEE
jgi:hypothetical protein